MVTFTLSIEQFFVIALTAWVVLYVSAGEICPNPQKIVALTALSPTQSVTSLRQFIVLTTYFKQCIKGFSQLMKPYYILYLFIFNNLRQK